MVFQSSLCPFRAAVLPIDPGLRGVPRGGTSWSPSCFNVSSRVGAQLTGRVVVVIEMSSLVNRFFRAACGEACMLAARFLDSWQVELSNSAFIRRLCVGAANSVSLFIPGMSSSAF